MRTLKVASRIGASLEIAVAEQPDLAEVPLLVARQRPSSRLRLPDEAEIEADQEQDEMNERAIGTDLGRFDKARSQERHRDIGQIQIEQDA